jgi:O-antigen/teichoic acid export membrane protein
LLAFSIPVVIITAGLRGILEAYQRFDLVNLVRIPLGVFTFLFPVIVLYFSNQLEAIVVVLVCLRVVILAIHIFMAKMVIGGLFKRFKFSNQYVYRMLGFGGWMTVTNIVGPMMVYLDRFVIASFLGMAAVAYYVTPYELITKLWVIPAGLVGVLFPIFAASTIKTRPLMVIYFWRSVRLIFLLLFPITLLVIVFADYGLKIWLTDSFAYESTLVLQILAIGVLLNSLSQVPFAFIQSIGRPDLTAKLHVVELPFYLILLWILMGEFGLVGAAIAWTVRIGFDALAMFALSVKLERVIQHALKREALIVGLGLAVLSLSFFPKEMSEKISFASFSMILFILIGWRFLMPAKNLRSIREMLFGASSPNIYK